MDFAAARKNMIECQLRTKGIVDEAVLGAMSAVPRERFVPEGLRAVAYIDEDMDLGNGRTLMEPLVLAGLLQGVAVAPGDVALVIGSGIGYATAVLARLAATVFAHECVASLAASASELAAELGLDNVIPVDGALLSGCPEHAPYNVILIEGMVDRVPDAVADQLADGGRLAAVVRDGRVGRATLLRRDAGRVSRRVLFDAAMPALPEFREPRGFVF
jgi:protein-L-isoaspartate(D-aspartate) O-methyltransferase